MRKYRIYGQIIESDMEFSYLIPADDHSYDEKDIIRIKREVIGDEVNERLENTGVNYLVSFEVSCFRNPWGYFLVKYGTDIFYEIKDGAGEKDIIPFILGYCLSMALLQKKILAIHCSAVCVPKDYGDGEALLIVGESGAGKSTLTRKLLDEGFGFMADDIAAISFDENIYVHPTFPYQKLCRNEIEANDLDKSGMLYIDENKDKFLVPVKKHFVNEPQKLKGMIYIVPAMVDNVEVHELSGFDQFMAFKNNIFMHKMTGEWEKEKGFLDLCLKAAGKCPVYVILRPIGKNTVESMCASIKNLFLD